MTVERKVRELLTVNRTIVMQAVQNVLNADPRYRNVVEQSRDFHFTTIVKPSWWLLGTKMVVTLTESDAGTMVSVRTVSQPYIIGDVFHCYDRYIQNFLDELKKELSSLT